MPKTTNRWQRLRNAYRHAATLSEEDRKLLFVLLRRRDRALTAELEALLEQTDERDAIFAAVAAEARELEADVRVDPDVKRLISIVRALRELRRARTRASADAGAQTRVAGTKD